MLIRFDPFREMERAAGAWWNGRAPGLPMDAYRRGDEFIVHFDLPGVDPSSIDLTVEKNVLTVSAERHWEPEEGNQVVVAERPQGSFSRQLFIGEGLAPDGIEATYDGGVLTVQVPVAEQAKPRKVQVTSTGSSAAIETGSTAAA